MHTIPPPETSPGELSEKSEAFAMIEEAVKELGVRFIAGKNRTLYFQRGRFNPDQNIRSEELREYIIQTLSAVAREEPKVRDALTLVSHDSIDISIL